MQNYYTAKNRKSEYHNKNTLNNESVFEICLILRTFYLSLTLTEVPFLEISTLSSLANQPRPKSAKFHLRSNSFLIFEKVV